MSNDPHLNVTLVNDQQVAVDEGRLTDMARTTLASLGAKGEMTITLVPPERIAQLNEEWMGLEGPTDVLSFPVDGLVKKAGAEPVLIGDVVICPEVAQSAGNDLQGELDLLVVHGVLHLLGHDHDTPGGADAMRSVEKAISGRAGATAP